MEKQLNQAYASLRSQKISKKQAKKVIKIVEQKVLEDKKIFKRYVQKYLSEQQFQTLQKKYPCKLNEDVVDGFKKKLLSWIEDYISNDSFVKQVTNMLLQRINIKIEY